MPTTYLGHLPPIKSHGVWGCDHCAPPIPSSFSFHDTCPGFLDTLWLPIFSLWSSVFLSPAIKHWGFSSPRLTASSYLPIPGCLWTLPVHPSLTIYLQTVPFPVQTHTLCSRSHVQLDPWFFIPVLSEAPFELKGNYSSPTHEPTLVSSNIFFQISGTIFHSTMEARDTAATCPSALPVPPEPACSHIPSNICPQSLLGVPEFTNVTPSTLVQTRSFPGLMLRLSACPLPKQEGFSLKKSPRTPCTFPLSGSSPLPWRCWCNAFEAICALVHTPSAATCCIPCPIFLHHTHPSTLLVPRGHELYVCLFLPTTLSHLFYVFILSTHFLPQVSWRCHKDMIGAPSRPEACYLGFCL